MLSMFGTGELGDSSADNQSALTDDAEVEIAHDEGVDVALRSQRVNLIQEQGGGAVVDIREV